MPKRYFDDLFAFATIAREGSFTRAAAQLGVSQSALSQSMKSLEARLELRLLTRNTRSVSTTDLGDRLLETIGPSLSDIESEIAELQSEQQRPTGTIRITALDFVAEYTLWPRIERVLERYPDISIELSTDYRLTDIVANRFDIGVRLGSSVEQDMISIPLQESHPMVIIAAPGYIARHGTPRTVDDLQHHQAANLRLPTHGATYAWELARGDDTVNVRVPGRLLLDSVFQIRTAVRSGHGLGFVPREMVEDDLERGDLVTVLNDWAPIWPPHHLFYPSRRQSSAALRAVVNELRYRPGAAMG